MDFHEIRFPASLSFGALGGPERRTDVVTLANGFEERNSPWSMSRRRFDAGLGLRSLDDIEALVAFFEARGGRMHGFRWKDWGDYKSGRPSAAPDAQDQILGVGDEVRAEFQLVKRYRSGAQEYVREIRKPVPGTVKVAVGGVPQQEGIDWEVDTARGVISFAHPPDVPGDVTAGFEFDLPVRFDTDRIAVSVQSFQAGEVPEIPVVEVRI